MQSNTISHERYIRPYFSHNDENHIQALQVIERVESRRNSMVSVKAATSPKRREDDQEALMKSNTIEEIPLEAVSLN